MSISRSVFENARRPLRDRVLEFLREHAELAYRVDEVFFDLDDSSKNMRTLTLLALREEDFDRWCRDVERALEGLVAENLVERHLLVAGTFYCVAVAEPQASVRR